MLLVLLLLLIASKQPWFAIRVGLGMSTIAVFTVGRGTHPSSQFIKVFRISPVELRSIGKVQAFSNLVHLYLEAPYYVLVGVGPGTYSSRAFQLLAQIGPAVNSPTNVLRDYVPGSLIDISPLARKYVIPLLFKETYLLGSWTVDGPYTSYVSLLAEVGILGFVFYMLVYWRVVKLVWESMMEAYENRDAEMFSLAFASLGGIGLLFQMSFFDNWLEVSRVTVPLWLLFVGVLYYREVVEESEL